MWEHSLALTQDVRGVPATPNLSDMPRARGIPALLTLTNDDSGLGPLGSVSPSDVSPEPLRVQDWEEVVGRPSRGTPWASQHSGHQPDVRLAGLSPHEVTWEVTGIPEAPRAPL